jgi:hypothetical protein
MTRQFFILTYLMFSATSVFSQHSRLDAGVGLDNSSNVYAHEGGFDTVQGVSFSRQRVALPVYWLGLSRETARENLQSLNILFTYRNTVVPDLLGSTPGPELFVNAGEQTYYRIALMFEQLYCLNCGTQRHKFYLGFTVATGFESFEFSPSSSIYIPQSNYDFTIEPGGMLKWQFCWKNGWAFNASYGFSLLRSAVSTSEIENPLLTPEQQKSTEFSLDFGGRSILRVGIGIPLGNSAPIDSSLEK